MNQAELIQKENFFNINPEQAIAVLSLMAIEDVTPSVQDEAKKIDIEATVSAEKFKKKKRIKRRIKRRIMDE